MNHPRHVYCTVLAALVLAASVGCMRPHQASAAAPVASGKEQTVYPKEALFGKVPAPEFPAGMQWLNTDHAVTLKELRGKVVLLDFWTYCCINCMHVIPDLKKLEHKYADSLVVIGVHSAKFNNEQQTGNIRNAVLRYELEHPVVNDAQMQVWDAYGVHSWPTFVLIDPQGKLLGMVSGEGVYDRMDGVIGATIEAHAKEGSLKSSPPHWVLERDHAPQTQLSFPGKLESDEAAGRLFISDSNHNRILVVGLDGQVQDVIGSGAEGLTDGSYSEAEFHRPQGMAFDAKTSALYIADTENHALRKVDLTSKRVTTLAGDGQQAAHGEVGPRLSSPWDLALLNGQLYIAMAGTHQLWAYDLASGALRIHAGNGSEELHNGALLDAGLAQPSGITSDGKGLFFADSEVSAVRHADVTSGGSVTTLVGHGLFDYADVDGVFDSARLQHCIGVDYHAGDIYVADSYNHKVKRLDLAQRTVETVVGTGRPGYADGQGRAAQLAEPNDVAWARGIMYIADTNNSLIRTYDPKTNVVGTFVLRGLNTPAAKPATQMPAAPAPDVIKMKLSAVQLPPAGGTLRFNLKLPEGTHFNEEQAPIVKASCDNSAVHFGEAKLDKKGRLNIPVKIDKGQRDVFTATATIELGVFFCDLTSAAQCYLDNPTFELPLEIGGEGQDEADIDYDVKMP